jgi:PleD family two-component response regulator
VVLLEGEDYKQRQSLIEEFERKMEDNNRKGLVVISTGLDIYRPGRDICFDSIFERADQRMYERKKSLKSMNVKSA